eukprot:Partr_v1_DN28636_c3_g1_i3_m49509 putative Dna replication helicase
MISEMILDTTKASVMVIGTLLHELFQITMSDHSTQLGWESIQHHAKDIVKNHLMEIYSSNMTENAVLDEMRGASTGFKWFHDHILGQASKQSEDTNVIEHRGNRSRSLKITEILDIEEGIWSPMYGLKGKIDATVMVMDKHNPFKKPLMVPLEVKTGKNNFESASSVSHRAQTSLYTLMLTDRYGPGIEYGLLYYLRESKVISVPYFHDETRSLLIARNKLAGFTMNRTTFPKVVQNPYMCSKCYAVSHCSTLHKVFESGSAGSFGCAEIFNEKTGHLTIKQMEFVKHWMTLIWLEDGHNQRIVPLECDIEGERNPDRVIMNVINANLPQEAPGMFRSSLTIADPQMEESLSNYNIISGDHVKVTILPRSFGFASGFVESITNGVLILRCDKVLSGKVRVEKNQLAFGTSLLRGNLLRLVSNNEMGGENRLSQLIIEGQKPRFKDPIELGNDVLDLVDNLNECQRKAITKVLHAEDYALIFGMPGTGKTTAIVTLVQCLVKQGKSVLLASYTNTALDNVLLKLQLVERNFIRLGSKSKIPVELHGNIIDGSVDINSIDELAAKIQSAQIVGCTCLGITHPLFGRKRFDYCIIDEAAQVLLPAAIGPLMNADKFVLVGDPFQLPPVVQNEEAGEKGLGMSLFQLLFDQYPEAIVELKRQYRMNSQIMDFANRLFYHNKLIIGSPAVARQTLSFVLKEKSSYPLWLRKCIDPARSVIFVNTDSAGKKACEVRRGGLLVNEYEANVIHTIVEAYTEFGLRDDQIAVISQYKAQLNVIGQALKESHSSIEIHTVDRYQGRDKDLILMSMVRSNAE